MKYDNILAEIEGKGVQKFDQTESAIKSRIDIKNGVCRALVVMWLRSKSDGSDFWKGRGTINEGLLSESNRLKNAVDLQQEYSNVATSRFIPDSATKVELGNSGIIYDQSDVTASAQFGFAVITPSDEPAKIADKVLSSSSRFFILSIKGKSGAHSIGIHRPYSLIGKSDQAHFFDPNIGEFEVTTKRNFMGLISKVNSLGYKDISIDLNKSYILWSFKKS